MSVEAPPPLPGDFDISADQVVKLARDWLGTHYCHQASTKSVGTDCLGLIRGVYRSLYGREPADPPPYTPDWNERHWQGQRWSALRHGDPLLEAARAHLVLRAEGRPEIGDVLIFRVNRHGPAKHCGILSEPERFVHAHAGQCVAEAPLNRWWYSRLAGVFSFPGVI